MQTEAIQLCKVMFLNVVADGLPSHEDRCRVAEF